LVPEVPPPQIGFVCLCVKRMRGRTASVSRTQFYFDLFRYCLCHLFLQFHGMADVPVVAACPHMHLVMPPDDLHPDPHLCPITTNAALEDIADAQLACNLLHTLRRLLVGHHCCARDHPKLVGT